MSSITSLPMSEAASQLQADPSIVLLDVRTPDEFAEGHIPSAVNLDYRSIMSGIDEIASPNDKIFVYCRSGHRSLIAARYLEEIGFTQVTNIGGILDWKGPLETPSNQ